METIWILNHYAAAQYLARGGRHYWFSRKLVERGHDVTVFSASTLHGPKEARQVTGEHQLHGVHYRFLDTPAYSNRPARAWNVLTFYRRMMAAGRESEVRPSIIYASSVHPLTLLAGIRLGRRFGVPVVCEVRDLWPLSIEVYEPGLRGSLFTRMLYRLEHWLYRHADQLVFTMEGGGKYIRDRGWDESVDLAKVHHINNGIDLDAFSELAARHTVEDPELDDPDLFTVVYTGSIRTVNKVDALVDAARELESRGVTDVRILVYGEGDKLEELEHGARDVRSVVFKGQVPKQDVPQLLRRADALIVHGDQGELAQYGTSMNKLFEYLASGRPIVSDCLFGFDPVVRGQCGRVVPHGTPSDLADSILELRALPAEEIAEMGLRARRVAEEYDFEVLTDRLEAVLAEAHASVGRAERSLAT